MTSTNFLRSCSVVFVLWCLLGCTADVDRRAESGVADGAALTNGQIETSPDRKQQEIDKVATQSLIVSHVNDAGATVRLGVLKFDGSKQAELVTEGSGPNVEQLRRDWKEVSGRKELIWKQSIADTIDGEQVTRVVGQKVHPGDADYIYAVLSTLERSFGYEVDVMD